MPDSELNNVVLRGLVPRAAASPCSKVEILVSIVNRYEFLPPTAIADAVAVFAAVDATIAALF